MKPLRQLCAATVLVFALGLPAFAGDMECGNVPPPPPPQQTASVIDDTATGTTATNETSSEETTFVDPVTELTLDILQSVLSIF